MIPIKQRSKEQIQKDYLEAFLILVEENNNCLLLPNQLSARTRARDLCGLCSKYNHSKSTMNQYFRHWYYTYKRLIMIQGEEGKFRLRDGTVTTWMQKNYQELNSQKNSLE